MQYDDEDVVKMVQCLYRVLCLYNYVHLGIQMHVAVHHVHQIRYASTPSWTQHSEACFLVT